jgi:hypothetical protein
MAATVLGTAHLYGVSGTVTNATVLSFSQRTFAANTAQTEDESGNVIERRYDDTTNEATITIRLRTAYTPPTIGSTITYSTVTYEVVDIERSEQNKGFREMTINLIKSAGISYT